MCHIHFIASVASENSPLKLVHQPHMHVLLAIALLCGPSQGRNTNGVVTNSIRSPLLARRPSASTAKKPHFLRRMAAIKPTNSLKSLIPFVPLLGAAKSASASPLDSVAGLASGVGSTFQQFVLQPVVNPALSTAQELVVKPVGSFLANPVVGDLGVYLSKTVIAWGVPTAVLGLAFVLAAPKPSMEADIDLVEDDDDSPSLNPFQKPKKKEPKQYLKIERLNDKLDSFNFTLTKATVNPREAQRERRRRMFSKRYGGMFVSKLSDSQIAKLLKADAQFRKAGTQMQNEINKVSRQLRGIAAEQGSLMAKKNGEESGMRAMMKAMQLRKQKSSLVEKQAMLLEKYNDAEQNLISTLSAELEEEDRKSLGEMLKKAQITLQDGVEGLSVTEEIGAMKPHVFVMSFPGDVTASQVKGLREEVTAVIRSANQTRGDEVLLVLNTGGGTVTGYGLAAAQLIRIKEAGLNLTICVEQVAASGGYMMACCADRLIASPFAVLGSIGVVTQQPNVYERLNREGVEFLTVTAGKYKRTLTPFKKPTDEDFAKTKEDLEAIWTLFKDFVKNQRPTLDVGLVATGETWFGQDALERNLVDELKTTDDVLLEKLDQGAEIFTVKYSDPVASPIAQLLPSGSVDLSLRQLIGRWLLGDRFASLIDATDSAARPRYQEKMLIDRTAQETWFMDK